MVCSLSVEPGHGMDYVLPIEEALCRSDVMMFYLPRYYTPHVVLMRNQECKKLLTESFYLEYI